MASIVKSLRIIADPTRIRILALMRAEELSVAELQEILAMGQSRISTQLAQLKQAGLVEDRRLGKRILYAPKRKTAVANRLWPVIEAAALEVEEVARDQAALSLVMEKRQDKARTYFNELAGKFGRHYCPGRSWKGLAETLLKLMPPMVIADLGAGEGTFSQLMAQKAKQVIAVDNSEKMVEYGAELAKEHGFLNLEYRLGDISNPPIEDASVDIAFFSQALHHANNPQRAVDAAHRILKPGGRIVILDLLKHRFEKARDMYSDVWLGFSEMELLEFMRISDFREPEMAIVHKEEEKPNFQVVLAIAEKE